MELEGYSRPTCTKLVHSAMTRSNDRRMCSRQAERRRVSWLHQYTDNCCGEIFFYSVQDVEITHVTPTTPTQATVMQLSQG